MSKTADLISTVKIRTLVWFGSCRALKCSRGFPGSIDILIFLRLKNIWSVCERTPVSKFTLLDSAGTKLLCRVGHQLRKVHHRRCSSPRIPQRFTTVSPSSTLHPFTPLQLQRHALIPWSNHPLLSVPSFVLSFPLRLSVSVSLRKKRGKTLIVISMETAQQQAWSWWPIRARSDSGSHPMSGTGRGGVWGVCGLVKVNVQGGVIRKLPGWTETHQQFSHLEKDFRKQIRSTRLHIKNELLKIQCKWKENYLLQEWKWICALWLRLQNLTLCKVAFGVCANLITDE